MPQSQWLSNKQVAERLFVSPKTITRWAQEGRLPFQRTLGGHRRYDPKVIDQLAASLVFTPKSAQEPAEAGP